MTPLKHLWVALAVAASTSLVAVGDGVRLGGPGLLVEMVPLQPNGVSGSPVASADCRVKINHREVILHWKTLTFQHENFPEQRSDAVLTATMTRRVGSVSVSPQQVTVRTRLERGNDSAAIAMGIAGNGRADLKLDVGLEGGNGIAGRHFTTVFLTITGH